MSISIWPNGAAPSVPKRISAARSMKYTELEVDMEEHPDGSIWLIIRVSYDPGERFKFWGKVCLPTNTLGAWKQKIDRRFDAINACPELFPDEELPKAA
jgi:hypothetical protein